MTRDKIYGARKPSPYEVYRQRVRAFWEVKTAVRQLEALSAGMFPFNGSWLTEAQIAAQRSRLKREDRALIGDFVVLAITVLGLSAAVIVLIEFVL